MGGKETAIYEQTAEHYRRTRAEILARFPGSTREMLGMRTLAGQTLPGPEAVVASRYRLVGSRGGSSIDEGAALGVYGFLSNLTHPTLYPCVSCAR